jgi:pyruvate dehydrogenase E2 component (dihydrolipoamide acetyltransferase)
MLPLSLTFDHRLIYGAESARFMNTVIKHLEDPDLMLIEGK